MVAPPPARPARPANLARAFFHLSGATIGIVVIQLVPGRAWMVGIATAVALAAWTMELPRRRSEAVNDLLMRLFGPVAHAHEREHVNSATWYATALVLLAAAFTPVANTMGLAILGIADPVAGMVGRRWGRHRLVSGRSLEGALGFVVAGTGAAFALARALYPEVAWSTALAAAGAAALAGAVTELYSTQLDDNFSIPLVAAGVAHLALAALAALSGTSPGPG